MASMAYLAANPFFLLSMLLTFFVIILAFILALAFVKVPNLAVLIFSNRLVFEIGNDGRIVPKKAILDGDTYRTRDGLYQFEKEDTCFWRGKPTILVLSPYSKAIRPKVMQVFKFLKDKHIYTVRQFRAIQESVELTADEWKIATAQKQQPQPTEEDGDEE